MKGRFEPVLRHFRGRWSGVGALPIGLQPGMHRLTLVQMQQAAAGRPEFRAAAAISYGCPREELLANPRRFKALIKRAFAEQPFKGKRVVACMPAAQVKIALVNFTVAEGESDAAAIVRELGERMKGNTDGTVLDYLLVRPEDQHGPRKEAIVALAAREQVTAYLDWLSDAGLRVDALDIGPIALSRVVPWVIQGESEPLSNLLLINFGSVGSYLTVVWGRRLMLDRSIEFSEQRLLAKVSRLLGMSTEDAKRALVEHGFAKAGATPEASEVSAALREVLRPEFASLAAEVSKTMIYTASRTRGRALDKIFFMGGVTSYAGIGELLSELLSMPVEMLDPFSIFPNRLNGGALANFEPRSIAAVATGLSLRNVKTPWPIST